jgi:hypothetical protein
VTVAKPRSASFGMSVSAQLVSGQVSVLEL